MRKLTDEEVLGKRKCLYTHDTCAAAPDFPKDCKECMVFDMMKDRCVEE